MSVKYSMRKLSGISSHNTAFYPQMKRKGIFSTKQIAEQIKQETSFTESDVIGVVSALSHLMAVRMADGYNVKIDGIGIFSASLKMAANKSKDLTHTNASSIEIGGVNFKVSSELTHTMNKNLQLQHAKDVFNASSTQLSKEERINLAQEFLKTHERMTVSDYSKLTGLIQGTAAHELRSIASIESNGIRPMGHGPFKYYTKNQA
jgi:predicted histone-like DNA-binding protein